MKFEAFELALELISALRPLTVTLRRHDKDLPRQLCRAASSVALNLSEGSRRSGGDCLHSFHLRQSLVPRDLAFGHFAEPPAGAEEFPAALCVAIAWQILKVAETAQAMAMRDRQQAMLFSEARAAERSEV